MYTLNFTKITNKIYKFLELSAYLIFTPRLN